MNLRKASLILMVILTAATFTGCSILSVFSDGVSGLSGRYFFYNGTRNRNVVLEAGQALKLTYSLSVKSGELRLGIVDPSGEVAWRQEFSAGADGTYTYEAKQAGTHKLVLVAERTSGSYKVAWDVTD